MDQRNQNQLQHQQQLQPKSREFVKCLSEFFKRDLISIPMIKKYPHQVINQRCGIKAATLELDTAAYPNIEYIAGNRLSVYPLNPVDHVSAIMKHLVDDFSPQPQARKQNPELQARFSQPLARFIQISGKDSLRMALTYLYDITTAPSRDLLRLMSDCCSNNDHKSRLLAICKDDDTWEKWICQNMRTLKTTFDEFNSCSMSAKSLISELSAQQPRQYSISSIKSSKRFKTEIIVFQHKFSIRQISSALQSSKERDQIQQQDVHNIYKSATGASAVPVSQNTDSASFKSSRSLRSVATFGHSPISTQQVKGVPSFSGPLMSQYASLSMMNGSHTEARNSRTSQPSTIKSIVSPPSASSEKQYDGLCSNYLLNLNQNDNIICEFVENPRFTLKGNRERPIMMIGQDIGVVAFRPFWQQRSLEHDRAQVFYTLFKDLSPKKFGDMQLVCLTGGKCKIEDLFKREINSVLTNKIISSVSYINRSHLLSILDSAATHSQSSSANATKKRSPKQQLKIEAKELIELGDRISKLLIDNNGCLYTCCDPQMTQAVEILVVESIARNSNLSRAKIMALLPRWKGRTSSERQSTTAANDTFLFTLENQFERAQIVQEIYESSI